MTFANRTVRTLLPSLLGLIALSCGSEASDDGGSELPSSFPGDVPGGPGGGEQAEEPQQPAAEGEGGPESAAPGVQAPAGEGAPQVMGPVEEGGAEESPEAVGGEAEPAAEEGDEPAAEEGGEPAAEEGGEPAVEEGGEPAVEEPPAEEPPVQEPPAEEPPPAFLERPTRGTTNLFTELLDIPVGEVDQKVQTAVNRIFGIGTGEPNQPIVNGGYRVYYELPQDNSRAFIWAADSNDVRSEGMSYGMMIAVQMDMQTQFDRLWNFAKQHMQFPDNSNITAWRRYFRWQGSVNTNNANNWQVNYGAQTGPAPDGEEYFAAALYLADRRWGSNDGINYEAEADALTSAMLNNPQQGSRTPVFSGQSNMVVFYPDGNSAGFSDPSYHLPAFYEVLFAQDGPPGDANRWRQIADVSRQYFVSSANGQTGLHPDYANFNGTPNAGGDRHDEFRYDAWRVVMNMGVDYAWGSQDARLRQQSEAYHRFFTPYLGDGNVTAALFQLNGGGADGGGSTALTATLAAGAFASNAANRADFVENLWKVGQQQGQYRYYQETVYALGLLATAGLYGYEWAD